MNKQTILSSILSAALLTLAACSNDENKENNEKVDVTKAVEFKVDFADYNDKGEADITRAGSKAEEPVNLEQKTVQLGNGLFALCTLQRDTTKQTRPAATRAIPNDTYTMLAYDAATHTLKGEMTGTVSGGVFTPTEAKILLAPGTYDFVLFNSKVTRNGNNLTVTRSNADAALIGRITKTITPTDERVYINFTLKHVGAKIKIKLTGYMKFPAITATVSSINATDVPGSSVYDASNGVWTVGTGVTVSANTTFRSGSYDFNSIRTYSSKSNEDLPFMPATDISKLKLTFNSGSIYLQNMANASLTFKPASTLKLEQNGAYVLRVKLMYNNLYLFSDGTTGFINETIYGGAPAATAKTPIAVVLSQSKHMAIALKDANGGVAEIIWSTYGTIRTNTYVGIQQNLMREALGSGAKSGLNETWDPSYTTSNVTGNKVKALNPAFPAFNAAANYDPGTAYTGSPALKWYLPSYSDWTWAFSALGFGDRTEVTRGDRSYSWYGNLAEVAFTQVGGKTIIITERINRKRPVYWSSSECFNGIGASAGQVSPEPQSMSWEWYRKESNSFMYPKVRAFVEY